MVCEKIILLLLVLLLDWPAESRARAGARVRHEWTNTSPYFRNGAPGYFHFRKTT